MKRFVIAAIALASILAGLAAWQLHRDPPIIAGSAAWQLQRDPPNLRTKQRLILDNFFKSHPDYRQILESECNCDEDISRMRTGANGIPTEPNYTPYYAGGDFNGDGSEDFAVMLHSIASRSKSLSVAVFNGPFHGVSAQPALLEDGAYGALFPPRPGCRECRLLMGNFESDNVYLFEPKGRSYELKYAGPTDEDDSDEAQKGGGETVAHSSSSEGGNIVSEPLVGSTATTQHGGSAPSETIPDSGVDIEQSSPAIPAKSAALAPTSAPF